MALTIGKTKNETVQSILGKPVATLRIAITIPSTHNFVICGEKIVRPADTVIRDMVINHIAANFSDFWGGCTITQTSGAWKDTTSGKVVYEPCTVISSFVSKFTVENARDLRVIALGVKNTFNQDAVLIEIGQGAYFI